MTGLQAAAAGWRDRVRSYRPADALPDLAAGLLVAALAVPQSLGYAAVAGVPVQVGLYTLPPALLAYAVFGSSRLLFMGPISTVSVLSGSLVRQLSGGDPEQAVLLTSALAVLAGVTLVAAGLLEVGWMARFLSQPIVTGFVSGLVVLIVLGELPALLGLDPPQGAVLDRVRALVLDLDQTQGLVVLLSACALAVLFAGGRWLPRAPWALVVLVGGIVLSQVLDLAGRAVPVVGTVPTGLPAPSWPWWGMDDALGQLSGLVTGGLAIAAVGLAEGLAAARTFRVAEDRLRDDRELVANGVADLAAGLFGGMAVGGSLSKTAANARAGARSQLSGVAAALVVVLVLVLAAGLLEPLPRAVLSAVVVHAVWGLVQPAEFVRFKRLRRNDFISALVAFGGVLALGPLNGLLLAVGQSLLGLVYRSSQVQIDRMGKVPHEKAAWGAIAHDEDREPVPGVLVLRPDGPIFWANADPVFRRIRRHLDHHPETGVVVLDLEASNQMDATTVDSLSSLLAELRGQGRDLFLVRIFGNVRVVLERSGFLDELGEGRLWHSISAGVKAAKRTPAYAAVIDAAEPADDETDDDRDHIVTKSADRAGGDELDD
ncbi:SulP family inorganic anion transporter [Nocardioides sp.]|uniref:SulP family inorganic anion transporter n=1 Tax=Nocardioides sp. TaxID=35761 RepID=UPI0035284A80